MTRKKNTDEAEAQTEAGEQGRPEKQTPPPTKRKLDLMLPCILTDAERLEFGRQMADSAAALGQLEDELEEAKKQNKARQASELGIGARCASIIRAGYESRKVPCEEVKDWKAFTVTVTRQDTGKVVEKRAMTNDERSMLPMEGV